MLSPQERLDELEVLFEELEDASKDTPIIVEGSKDVKALELLGITTNVISLSKGISLVTFCERISRRWKSAVILTDWDRKGGHLARSLTEALMTDGVSVNESIRARLAILSKKEVKDIQSLPRFVSNLRNLIPERIPAQPAQKRGKRI